MHIVMTISVRRSGKIVRQLEILQQISMREHSIFDYELNYESSLWGDIFNMSIYVSLS